jgi:hypothetical protein
MNTEKYLRDASSEIFTKGCIILLGAFLLNFLSGCAESSGTAASSDGGTNLAPSVPVVPTVPSLSVTLDVKYGRDYSCFTLNKSNGLRGELWCKGTNTSIELNTLGAFNRIFLNQKSITDLTVFDDSVYFTTYVNKRPYTNTPGVATYGIGEASLGPGYSGWPIIYGGPIFSAAYMSPEVTYSHLPMMGGDIVMVQITNETYVSDGTGLTGVSSENCTLTATKLTCQTFTTTSDFSSYF